ncbi:hypothetical protein H4219_001733 [Mycoemilia scoparia]|uniref:NAD(P)-binding protein n=1 Tax=Mycoemilia scoparia TaxID=417184 RepID=A0A9W8A7G3_9FUNG|nr:hypothetical protein H4219_001733 [Mycoemilia scoparia]
MTQSIYNLWSKIGEITGIQSGLSFNTESIHVAGIFSALVCCIFGYGVFAYTNSKNGIPKPQKQNLLNVVVVGASSGIGKEIAIQLAKSKANKLILVARREEQLREVQSTCYKSRQDCSNNSDGGLGDLLVKVIVADVNKSDDREALCSQALSFFDSDSATESSGGIDLLVLCAGAITVKPVLELLSVDTTIDSGLGDSKKGLSRFSETLGSTFSVNFFAPVDICNRFLPALLCTSASGGRSPSIMVISSMAGLIGAPTRSIYSASKHALHGYFDSLRTEIEKFGVSVTLVCPGTVDTELRGSAIDANNGSDEAAAKIDATKAKKRVNKGISAEICASKAIDATLNGERMLCIPFSYKIAYYLRVFFPNLVDRLAKKKYGY